jgi:hypothetical protein
MRTRWVWILALALACGRGAEESATAGGATPAAAEEPTGPGPWVGEIRAGLRGLPSVVVTDPVAARRSAVELYATRQEALEGRWGVRGTEAPDSTLARSVMDAEASFHELLALLNREAAPDSAAVAAAVAELDRRYAAVIQAFDDAR